MQLPLSYNYCRYEVTRLKRYNEGPNAPSLGSSNSHQVVFDNRTHGDEFSRLRVLVLLVGFFFFAAAAVRQSLTNTILECSNFATEAGPQLHMDARRILPITSLSILLR